VIEALLSRNDLEGENFQEIYENEHEVEKELEKTKFLDFSIIVEDNTTGEEFELPTARVVRWRSK